MLGNLSKTFKRIFSVKGVPLPPVYPLNGKSFCQKNLSGKGGHPPPLNGKSLCPKTLNGKGAYPPPP